MRSRPCLLESSLLQTLKGNSLVYCRLSKAEVLSTADAKGSSLVYYRRSKAGVSSTADAKGSSLVYYRRSKAVV